MGWPNYDDGDAASAVPTVAYTPDPIAPTCLVWGPSGGAYTLTTLANGFPVQPGTGTTWAVTGPLTDAQLRATAVPVSLGSTVTVTGAGGTFPVTDSGGSLTVDGTVSLGAGTNAVGTVTAVGAAAHDAPASGNPVLIAGVAANGQPANNTPTAAGDATRLMTTTFGSLWATLCDNSGIAFTASEGALLVATTAISSSVRVAAIGEGDGGAFPLCGTYVTVDGVDSTLLWACLRDSAKNEIASATATPGASDRGLVVREAAAPWATDRASVSATSAANTVVKASAGRLCRVIVTTAGTGTGSILIYDNATTNSGTVIGALPATVSAGAVYEFDCPATAGITVRGVASGPVVTVSYR